MFICPHPTLPASRKTNLHQLYSLLHVYLSPLHPTCLKKNKPPSTLFIVACLFVPTPPYLPQEKQTSINSIHCCMFICPHPTLPASRKTNLHQLYLLLHVHLSPPHPTCLKKNKPSSTLFIVACSFESQSLDSCYKYKKPPSTLFIVAR